jgi:PEP-CTERM motif-containing protein
MTRFVFLASSILSITWLCPAGPCGMGSLASYVVLGTAGCSIGANTLSNFVVLSGTAGATPILSADVTITPIGNSDKPGINAVANVTATAGTLLETFFTYQISGQFYVSDSIALAGSTQSGDGAVTDVQNFCAGGTFGPDGVTGCNGSPGSLTALNGVQNRDSTSLGPAAFLSVTDDFTIDGGLTGLASGGNISDQFAAVPEPATVLLVAIGFALALGLKSRSTSASSFRR